jgi:hypothetical protein
MSKNSKTIRAMTDGEVLDASPISRVRAIISDAHGTFDQAFRQRKPPNPIEVSRMELEFANRICSLFGVGLP